MVLEDMYRPGFAYAKAGIHLLEPLEIVSADAVQGDHFTPAEEDARIQQLLVTVDRINARFGGRAIQPGVAGLQALRGGEIKLGKVSPAPTRPDGTN